MGQVQTQQGTGRLPDSAVILILTMKYPSDVHWVTPEESSGLRDTGGRHY
jgi:hypothetical protein